MPKFLRVLVVGVLVVAVVLVIGVAIVASPVGTRWLVRKGIAIANETLNGSVTVEGIDGSLLRQLRFNGVVVRDASGTVLASAEAVEVGYNPFALIRRRFVLRSLVLERPAVVLKQHPADGSLTVTELRPVATDSVAAAPAPLVVIETGEVSDGSVVVESAGVVRHIESIHASIDGVQLSSPDPDAPMVFDLSDVRASIDEPPFTVVDAQLLAEVDPDTVRVRSLRVVSPESQLQADGWMARDGSDTLRPGFEVNLVATRITSDELVWLSPLVPAGLVMDGAVTARSPDGRDLHLDVDHILVTPDSDSGDVRVSGGIVLGSHGGFRIDESMSLTADRFSTSYLKDLIDSTWTFGHLDGSLQASGPYDSLRVNIDAALLKSGIRSPLAEVNAAGQVAVSDTEIVRFDNVELQTLAANITALRDAGMPMPADGHLRLRGRLTGRVFAPRFVGEIVHRAQTGGSNVVRGSLGLEDLRQPLGVAIDLAIDSLQLETLTTALQEWQLTGTMSGQVVAQGRLDSLPFHVQLTGLAGDVTADGTMHQRGDSLRMDSLVVTVADLDVNGLNARATNTNLNGELRFDDFVIQDSVTGRALISLARSAVSGVTIDSVTSRVGLHGTQLDLDTLMLHGQGFAVLAAGGFGMESGYADTLLANVRIDSLGVLRPLVESENLERLSGAMDADIRLSGSVLDWTAAVNLRAPALAWNAVDLGGIAADGVWHNRDRWVDANLDVDSIQFGHMRFGDLTATMNGIDDAWSWGAETMVGGAGTWALAGQVEADSLGYRATFDSLALALWQSRWTADSGATLTWHGQDRTISNFTLHRRDAAGQLTIEGKLPAAQPGDARVTLDQLPLGDVMQLAGPEQRQVRGDLNGSLTIGGTEANPEYNGAFVVSDVMVDTLRFPPAQVDVDYADGRVHGLVLVRQEGQLLVRGEGAFPLVVRFPATVESTPDTISVDLNIDSLSGSWLSPFFPTVEDLEGLLAGRVAIRGTIDEPQTAGQLELMHGSLTLPELGTRYRDISGNLQLAADTIYVDRLAVRDATNGTAVATGFVHLAELQRPILGVDVDATNLLVMNSDEYAGVYTTGRARLEGPFWGGTLTGDVTVNAAVLQVSDIIEKQVINLEDSLFGSFVDTMVLREEQLGNPLSQRFLDSLRINRLRVRIGPNVSVQSTEGNVQVSGDLIVNKVGEQYPINGVLNVVRGTYEMVLGPAVTRPFTVTGGEVRYFGTDSLDAVLDINARHVVRTVRGDQLMVFVNIGGTMRSPTVTLSSDHEPALPETEIISYLMFGAPSVQVFVGSRGREQRSIFQRGASQFTQLLAGRLEQSFSGLVDYFSITPGDPSEGFSETEIFVGKQLDLFGRSSFVTFSPRLCPRQPLSGLRNVGLSVETWIARHWLLDASLDPREGCQADTAFNSSSYQFGVDLLWVQR